MKASELLKMLGKMGLPVVQDFFTEEKDLPYLIFHELGKETFSADNIAYHSQNRYHIELYTERKDYELEEKLENLLKQNEVYWEQVENTYINSEGMHLMVYQI